MPLDLTPNKMPYYTIEPLGPPITNIITGLEYMALLSQVTTNAPTAAVTKDDITGITIARVGPGQYTLTKTGLFEVPGTTWYITTPAEPQTEGAIKMVWTDNNTLTIFTYNTSAALADDVLVNTPVYIRQIT